jgi:uncharacterized protein (TIGR00290 family)
MNTEKPKLLLSWSSGKDSAWALHILRQQNEFEIAGLFTTWNEESDRVAMHAVRRELVDRQATAVGLALQWLALPSPCTNAEYEARMAKFVEEARGRGVTHFGFGDLFLAEIRAYREQRLAGTGITPVFPLWTNASTTPSLAREMIAGGVRAVLTCVDPRQLSAAFAGREFDLRLLSELPPRVDACGEQGEFHTFCYSGPMFSQPIPVQCGERLEREGFEFVDLLPKHGG